MSTLTEIMAGAPGSGCNPEAARRNGTACGRPSKNVKGWKQEHGPMGSNPGGVYKAPDGSRHYVKFYGDKAQGKSEVLANKIYKALGIQVPDSRSIRIDGREAVASRMLDVRPMTVAEMKKAPGSVEGFVADAYLANHDVIGLEHDNLMKDVRTGKAVRVDNGGSLFHRAMGGVKTFFMKNPAAVPELDSMRNPEFDAGEVFGHLKDKDLKPQAKKLVSTLSDSKLNKFISEAGFKGLERRKYLKYLVGRRNAIASRFL